MFAVTSEFRITLYKETKAVWWHEICISVTLKPILPHVFITGLWLPGIACNNYSHEFNYKVFIYKCEILLNCDINKLFTFKITLLALEFSNFSYISIRWWDSQGSTCRFWNIWSKPCLYIQEPHTIVSTVISLYVRYFR